MGYAIGKCNWNIYCTFILIFIFCAGSVAMVQVEYGENPTQETTMVETEETVVEETAETEVLLPVVDEIVLKQQEMRDTTVLIRTCQSSGSGTIIDCLETDIDELFEYRVLTNAHVTHGRFITILRGVNSLTGRAKTETIDIGCIITTFDHKEKTWHRHQATVVAEDTQYDFALLTFQTKQELAIATLANNNMLDQVRVFDEVFAIGCQLGCSPSPTTGIISRIITGDNGEKEWVIYGNTAQISPGSSGGGLFKRYNGHYFLIGIPFSAAIADNGQIFSHLSHAISIATAKDFIEENAVTCP